jgi:AmiR/NasT family two-component response regulator
MRERDLDDEAAYALLRKESMRQRVSVEELAMRMLAEPAPKRSSRKA